MDSRPEHIREVADASLKRLRTDRIDLFYQHRVDPNVPIEDVAGAVKDLIQGGQGQALRTLRSRRADDSPRARGAAVTAIQSEYSLWWREPGNKVLPTCEELGIGFVPYQPPRQGLPDRRRSTTTPRCVKDDFRNILPRFCPKRAKPIRRWSICSA